MTETKPKSALDIQGWMFPEELAWLSEQAAKCEKIAEIGCWKGRSTFALLSACPGTVYAIDHFKGSTDEPGHAEARDGSVRTEFLANCGHFPNLKLIERDSVSAASLFADGELDMVFIDGSHRYEDVIADIRAWHPKAKRILAGHDFSPEWPGVVQAINGLYGPQFSGFARFACQSIWYVNLAKSRRLNLGCSDSLIPGFSNVDLVTPADELADLSGPWPWPDSSVEFIRAHDIIEHLADKTHTMNEAWRVLQPGGKFEIVVPTTDGRAAFQDPGHVSFWNRHSFWYYEAGNPYRERFAKSNRVIAAFRVLGEQDISSVDGPKLGILLEAVK